MKNYQITNEDFNTIIGDFLDRSKGSRLEALMAVIGLLGELKNSPNHPQLVGIASMHLTARGYSKERRHFKEDYL